MPDCAPDNSSVVTSFLQTVLFYKSGHYLASGGDDGQVRLWDIRIGNCVRLWEATDGSKGIEALAFSEGGNEIVCGTDGGLVEWVGLESGSCVSLHLEETVSALLCHQRDRVIAGTINGGVYVLDQAGPVSRECDNQFSRIFNIQGQPARGSQALVLREYE